jgi:hypothetical protein
MKSNHNACAVQARDETVNTQINRLFIARTVAEIWNFRIAAFSPLSITRQPFQEIVRNEEPLHFSLRKWLLLSLVLLMHLSGVVLFYNLVGRRQLFGMLYVTTAVALDTFDMLIEQVISISTLLECARIASNPNIAHNVESTRLIKNHKQQALYWYTRAINNLRIRINNGTSNESIALLTCILFMYIELLRNNGTAALHLYQCGARLITALEGTLAHRGNFANLDQLEDALIPVFLSLSHLTVVQGHLPPNFKVYAKLDGLDRFFTLQGARMALFAHVHACIKFSYRVRRSVDREQDTELLPILLVEQKNMADRLNAWGSQFKKLGILPNTKEADRGERYAAAALLMGHASIVLLNAVCLSDEMAYDQHLSIFKNMIEWGGCGIALLNYFRQMGIAVTMYPGIFFPLYATARKCRHPGLRREALTLLGQVPSGNGIYETMPFIRAATKIIEWEERDYVYNETDTFDTAHLSVIIPNSRRLYGTDLRQLLNENGELQWIIQVTRQEQDENGKWNLVEDSITL